MAPVLVHYGIMLKITAKNLYLNAMPPGRQSLSPWHSTGKLHIILYGFEQNYPQSYKSWYYQLKVFCILMPCCIPKHFANNLPSLIFVWIYNIDPRANLPYFIY